MLPQDGQRLESRGDGGLCTFLTMIQLIRDAQYRSLTTPIAPAESRASDRPDEPDVSEGRESPPAARKNWQRIGTIARRAGGDDLSPSRSTTSLEDETSSGNNSNQSSVEGRGRNRQRRAEARNARQKKAKMMDLQYFLEMVDQKHRYGSNLRKYHNYWKSQPTTQNFFYWLDQGDGRDVELPECDRARLDREQVRYLSREERLSYLVTVDKQGRLLWAKNGERVWTKDTLYKDSMKGIVPVEDQGPTFQHNIRPDGADTDSTSESDEGDQAAEHDADMRYVNEDFHDAKGVAKLKEVSPAVIFNHLMRGQMKKGHKWIFVSD
jgi:hypothetical protein